MERSDKYETDWFARLKFTRKIFSATPKKGDKKNFKTLGDFSCFEPTD